MTRREFITLLGGAAAVWPIAARAQEPTRMRRVGVLMNVAENEPEGQAALTAFVRKLNELGWTDDRNVRLDVRWAAGDRERYRRYARELLALSPDVILCRTSTVVAVLQEATFCLSRRSTRSEPAWLTAWRSPAATPPDLSHSNIQTL